MMVDNALEIMKICEEKLSLGEGEAAQSMVMAAAMLAGNDHNILGLIKMMLETYETINHEEDCPATDGFGCRCGEAK